MAIAKGHITNWATFRKAFENDDVALMECFNTELNETVVVVCMVNYTPGGAEFVPFAQLFNANPYDVLLSPDPEGRFGVDAKTLLDQGDSNG